MAFYSVSFFEHVTSLFFCPCPFLGDKLVPVEFFHETPHIRIDKKFGQCVVQKSSKNGQEKEKM
jgi:hypothetical protein